ncbi:ketopantoate reductase C-terminal domain-containing protein [Paraburkholderia diazotrophica]|uniref:ketopantoate reductase C-terminal domain-containing protein n=1 Tax=Paraburkholderia diazotrophica TaxID=667676 RepID=UPI0031812BC5
MATPASVSLLAGCSTDKLIDDPAVRRQFLVGVVDRTIALGASLGVRVAIETGERLALRHRLGEVKTSMLQDVEAGRSGKIVAILGTLVGIARRLDRPAPLLDAVYALPRMRASVLGLLP